MSHATPAAYVSTLLALLAIALRYRAAHVALRVHVRAPDPAPEAAVVVGRPVQCEEFRVGRRCETVTAMARMTMTMAINMTMTITITITLTMTITSNMVVT